MHDITKRDLGVGRSGCVCACDMRGSSDNRNKTDVMEVVHVTSCMSMHVKSFSSLLFPGSNLAFNNAPMCSTAAGGDLLPMRQEAMKIE